VSLIALCADKGSPGVTIAALALAAVWPRRVAIAELDPAGGDLAYRLTDQAGHPRLRPEPGLLTLAAAVRRGAGGEEFWAHCQPVAGEVMVLPGLAGPEQGSGIAALWPALVRVVRDAPGGDVLADVGRLHPGSPALAVAGAADQVVCLARATPEGLVRLRDRLTHLLPALPATGQPRRVTAVLIADDRAGHQAVTATRTVLEHAGLPVAVLGFLALDPRAVAELQTAPWGVRLERSLLLRTARAVAAELTGTTEPAPATAAHVPFSAAGRAAEPA
jgi:hypothetical protein